MDDPEFKALNDELKAVLDKRGATDRYYFQVVVSDGVNIFQPNTSNLTPNDPIQYGKVFSGISEQLLMQFREWLVK
ncbi:MAG: hypothetical protein V1708_02435 [Candidatus Micrarchaeota archaeon]